ncbi:hypothetical protein ON010_g6382 [Phytophthora cinnamomi]|nr:hypothetical protein ON010_g6382 [Phytophthora cinnamomi]
MQFRFKRDGVESTKSMEAWTQWLKSTRCQTVHLLVYEFSLAMAKAQDLQEFRAACIQPPIGCHSRGHAAIYRHLAATTLGGYISRLGCRMWANHITRNLNSSTWAALISKPPPDYIVPMFNATETYLEQHPARLNRSARMALDCIAAEIAENDQFQRAHAAFGQRLAIQKTFFRAQKEVIEALICELPQPPRDTVIDPLPAIENIAGTEHEQ